MCRELHLCLCCNVLAECVLGGCFVCGGGGSGAGAGRDIKVNKIGEHLGFAYGVGYWTRYARTEWLPGEEEMEKCKDFYEL